MTCRPPFHLYSGSCHRCWSFSTTVCCSSTSRMASAKVKCSALAECSTTSCSLAGNSSAASSLTYMPSNSSWSRLRNRLRGLDPDLTGAAKVLAVAWGAHGLIRAQRPWDRHHFYYYHDTITKKILIIFIIMAYGAQTECNRHPGPPQCGHPPATKTVLGIARRFSVPKATKKPRAGWARGMKS